VQQLQQQVASMDAVLEQQAIAAAARDAELEGAHGCGRAVHHLSLASVELGKTIEKERCTSSTPSAVNGPSAMYKIGLTMQG
jgi:hypothetical protein